MVKKLGDFCCRLHFQDNFGGPEYILMVINCVMFARIYFFKNKESGAIFIITSVGLKHDEIKSYLEHKGKRHPLIEGSVWCVCCCQ